MPVWICICRPHPARERWVWAYCIFPREALRVCSFNYDGQCEGLNKRERANSTALTLFHFTPIIANEVSPAANFTIMPISEFITTAVAVAALVLSVVSLRKNSKNVADTLMLSVFSDYTHRFQEIMIAMPDSIFEGKAKLSDLNVRRYMELYFNLCSEEYHLHTRRRIPDDVWENWKEGMRLTTRQPIYQTAWKVLSQTYNKEFILFMHHEILNK